MAHTVEDKIHQWTNHLRSGAASRCNHRHHSCLDHQGLGEVWTCSQKAVAEATQSHGMGAQAQRKLSDEGGRRTGHHICQVLDWSRQRATGVVDQPWWTVDSVKGKRQGCRYECTTFLGPNRNGDDDLHVAVVTPSPVLNSSIAMVFFQRLPRITYVQICCPRAWSNNSHASVHMHMLILAFLETGSVDILVARCGYPPHHVRSSFSHSLSVRLSPSLNVRDKLKIRTTKATTLRRTRTR